MCIGQTVLGQCIYIFHDYKFCFTDSLCAFWPFFAKLFLSNFEIIPLDVSTYGNFKNTVR